jgi:hypothetical protein
MRRGDEIIGKLAEGNIGRGIRGMREVGVVGALDRGMAWARSRPGRHLGQLSLQANWDRSSFQSDKTLRLTTSFAESR